MRATAYGLYDDLRPAIRLLKFENTPSLAKPLGAMLAHAILHLQATSPSTLTVVPVPLFRGKRAYNQSTLLAQHALRIVRAAAPGWTLLLQTGLLRRVRHTESQFLLSPAQRRDNLRGAFQAGGDATGLDVLLIDDVYTTGATARECTRVLMAAGARSVRIATLARAGRDVAVRWHGLTAHFDSVPPGASGQVQPG
ncbi:MAG: ComF family protein [Janthinobacterium lividum]